MSSKPSSSSSSSSSLRAASEIRNGPGDLKRVVLRNSSGYSAESAYKPPKPIRGGIPLSFPQFSNNGSLEHHEFARNRFWNVDPSPPPLPSNSSDKTFIDLILCPKDLLRPDRTFWSHSFECRLRVTLRPNGELLMTSRIRNTNTDGMPFSFSFAYHTYFSVSDIGWIRYISARQKKITIIDHTKKQAFIVQKEGLPDTVVWNPWKEKAKALRDFGRDDYTKMLRVSPAAVERQITLRPGEEWTGRQKLGVVPSSYRSGQL